MSTSSSKGIASVGGSSLNASTSSLLAMRSSSMESLESTMSTTESTTEADRNRLTTVLQENAVLKSEIEVYRLKVKNLLEENRRLKQANVNIQAQAEQEEEFISNTLLKKIHSLKKEKETLAMNYEQEEEYLTNDLSRKLAQLRQEKAQLEKTLEQEQEQQITKLTRKIDRLEKDVGNKQFTLDQLRREKIDLENTLEQEQEMLVNKLWKRMEKVEREKRDLEARLGATPPPSPNDRNSPAFLNSRIMQLSEQVIVLKKQLEQTDAHNLDKIHQIVEEERVLKEENVRLQRRLQRETQRREDLTRQLSESESSLEMDDERHFNEMTSSRGPNPTSPSPFPSSPTRRSLSPSPVLLGQSTPATTIGFAPPPPIRGRTSSYGSVSTHLHSHTYNQTPSGGGMASVSTSALTGLTPHGQQAGAAVRLRTQSSGSSGSRPTTR